MFSALLICIVDEPPKEFTFDYSFWSHDQSRNFATQETVFEALGQDVLTNAFKGPVILFLCFHLISDPFFDAVGFNATLFAYGQTGSGKSFSMVRFCCQFWTKMHRIDLIR